MLNRVPLRVAVLCSRRAPGLVHLLTRPHRGAAWEIVCCVTSEETFDDEVKVERHGVPVYHHQVRSFYRARNPDAPISDLSLRADYDAALAARLRPHWPDVVLLSGYLLLLTAPMLDAYPSRILNTHHADLLQRTADGKPRFPGLRAVRDAILAGERETRSTVHRATSQVDDGQPLLRSWPFGVPPLLRWALATGADDVLRKAVWAHQEWMLRASFGPLMATALDLAAAGELDGEVRDLHEDGRLRPLVYA